MRDRDALTLPQFGSGMTETEFSDKVEQASEKVRETEQSIADRQKKIQQLQSPGFIDRGLRQAALGVESPRLQEDQAQLRKDKDFLEYRKLQQKQAQEGKVWSPEAGRFVKKDAFAPVAKYEEQFETALRKGLIPYESVTINGQTTTLNELNRKEIYNLALNQVKAGADAKNQTIRVTDGDGNEYNVKISDFLRSENAKNINNDFQVKLQNKQQEILALGDVNRSEYLKNELIKYDPNLSAARIQELVNKSSAEQAMELVRLQQTADVQQQIRKNIATDDELNQAELDVEVNKLLAIGEINNITAQDLYESKGDYDYRQFVKKLKETPTLQLASELKRISEVESLKQKLREQELDSNLPKKEREKQVADILARVVLNYL